MKSNCQSSEQKEPSAQYKKHLHQNKRVKRPPRSNGIARDDEVLVSNLRTKAYQILSLQWSQGRIVAKTDKFTVIKGEHLNGKLRLSLNFRTF